MRTTSFTYEEYLTPHMVLVEKIDENYSIYKAPSEEVLRSIGGVIMDNCIGRVYKNSEQLFFVIDKRGRWKAALFVRDGLLLKASGKKNSQIDSHCLKSIKGHLRGSISSIMYNGSVDDTFQGATKKVIVSTLIDLGLMASLSGLVHLLAGYYSIICIVFFITPLVVLMMFYLIGFLGVNLINPPIEETGAPRGPLERALSQRNV